MPHCCMSKFPQCREALVCGRSWTFRNNASGEIDDIGTCAGMLLVLGFLSAQSHDEVSGPLISKIEHDRQLWQRDQTSRMRKPAGGMRAAPTRHAYLHLFDRRKGVGFHYGLNYVLGAGPSSK